MKSRMYAPILNERILLLLVSIHIFSGCVKQDIKELDFFTVSMEDPMRLNELGTVKMEGTVRIDQMENLESVGFYMATQEADFESNSVTIVLASNTDENGLFSVVLGDLALDRTYYLKAFAFGYDDKMDCKRLVVSGDVKSYSPGFVFKLSTPIVKNNTVLLESILCSPDPTMNTVVEDHGFIISTDSNALSINSSGGFSMGSHNALDTFSYLIGSGLVFNTTYYFKSYAISPFMTAYSSTGSFRIKDGWEPGVNFNTGLIGASVATINGKAYMIGGCATPVNCSNGDYFNTLWKFDPVSNSWSSISTTGQSPDGRYNAIAFAIGSTLYYGFGLRCIPPPGNTKIFYNDLWMIDPESFTPEWYQLNLNLAEPTARDQAVSFVVEGKAYVGAGGNISPALNDFWEYDPSINMWNQVASLTSSISTNGAVSFVIASENPSTETAFVGTGTNTGGDLRKIWEFCPPANCAPYGAWIEKADLPGSARSSAVGFSINGKGYISTGIDEFGSRFNDLWELDPNTNLWREMNCLPGIGRQDAVAFVLNGFAYLGTGKVGVTPDASAHDFYKYTPEQ